MPEGTPSASLPTACLRVCLGQATAAGKKAVNQDAMGACIPNDGMLLTKGIALAVADGISSSPVSHVAAQTAVTSFLADYYATPDGWPAKAAAQAVITATNSWLYGQTRGLRMGGDLDRGYLCTLSALILKGCQAHLFHVGDSRIYRVDGSSLECLTQDHRVILSADEIYLGRALGMADTVDIDSRAIPVRVGDVFVVCTDGVFQPLGDKGLRAAFDPTAPSLQAQAEQVISLAEAAGSTDNLTIQIIRIEALPDPASLAFLDGGFLDGAPLLPVPAIPEPPCAFEGYWLERQIHRTLRSHIFLARPQAGGAAVALKIPAGDLRDDLAAHRRLMMEEWIVRRLNGPHVLPAASMPPSRQSLYSVAAYVEGQTLRQWMIDHPAPDLETVRGVIEQLVAGVRVLHRQGMIHQDLRPENVMIDTAGTVKIIDFGSTSVAGILEAVPDLQPAHILGTLQYTAPEYFLGEGGSWASDLFSLAVIAYEMLTGRLPYGAGVSRAQTAKAQARLCYRPAHRVTDRVPRWVDHALSTALSMDPTRRQDSLSAFLADLRRPSAALQTEKTRPLMERDPVLFWQCLCLALAVTLAWVLVG